MHPNAHRYLSAGCRVATVPDGPDGGTFPMTVMYPSAAPACQEKIGPYQMSLSMDAPIASGCFPLVLVSHGTGGSPLAYRTLAAFLAQNGFVVGLPEHPFNHRNDNRLEGTCENLANRPRHLRAAIDWAYAGSGWAGQLKPGRVALIGHSMGGYTALAAAGGVPASFPQEAADGRSRQIDVAADPRIGALVLLAPATVWFRNPGALGGVTVPILMLTAEKDPHTPDFHGRIVLDGLPAGTRIEHRVIKNAGHFSFLSPFPAEMTGAGFLPSQDPAGFDRERFHHEMGEQIRAFLSKEI